jgi:hypothetical protein
MKSLPNGKTSTTEGSYHSLLFLTRSNSKMLSWPNNSPLLVLLQFVDFNVLSGDKDAELREGGTDYSAPSLGSILTDPIDYATRVKPAYPTQTANAVAARRNACTRHASGNVTNLDFVELLLEEGTDPNYQDRGGRTQLMFNMVARCGNFS